MRIVRHPYLWALDEAGETIWLYEGDFNFDEPVAVAFDPVTGDWLALGRRRGAGTLAATWGDADGNRLDYETRRDRNYNDDDWASLELSYYDVDQLRLTVMQDHDGELLLAGTARHVDGHPSAWVTRSSFGMHVSELQVHSGHTPTVSALARVDDRTFIGGRTIAVGDHPGYAYVMEFPWQRTSLGDETSATETIDLVPLDGDLFALRRSTSDTAETYRLARIELEPETREPFD